MSVFLITGGAGFFGSILKQELLSQGHFCVSIDLEEDSFKHENFISIKGDIRDLDLLEKTFSAYNFDAIFHCAAILAHVKEDLKKLWSSNVDGTQNILDFSKKYGVEKIIFLSTNCLWAQDFKNKLVTEEEVPNPQEIYGKSKLEAEKILLSEKDKVKSVIFRCPTIMDEGRLGLLSILFEFLSDNKKLWMVGDGTNLYQFIYAKDLVQACILALNYNESDVFNIGSDDVKSFNEVYSFVIKKSDSKSKLAYFMPKVIIPVMKLAYVLGLSPLGPYQYKMISSNFVFDTSKIKSKLGFSPTLKNEEMLLKSYNYYYKNRDEIKKRKNVSAHSQSAKMGIIRILKWFS